MYVCRGFYGFCYNIIIIISISSSFVCLREFNFN